MNNQIPKISGPSDPNMELKIKFHLYSKYQVETELQKEDQAMLSQHPSQRKCLTFKAAKDRFSASKEAFEELKTYLSGFGIQGFEESEYPPVLTVKTSVANLNLALGIQLQTFLYANGMQQIMPDRHWQLPSQLAGHVSEVSGLSFIRSQGRQQRKPIQTKAILQGYGPQQLEFAYRFPAGDAKGQTIGVIELGGKYNPEDLQKYCEEFGLEVPTVEVVGEPSSDISPETYNQDLLETDLDIQVLAGLAQGAKLVIYYGNTILEALQLALADSKNDLSVISVSYAQTENTLRPLMQAATEKLLLHAALRGITVLGASGDSGAFNRQRQLDVYYPASSPLCLAVGGTALWANYGRETGWSRSGGGYSTKFQVPDFQTLPVGLYKQQFPFGGWGAGVPDVAALGASETPFAIVVEGVSTSAFGTSGSTPVWAALIARLNKKLGYRLGYINPLLYQESGNSNIFNQISGGNNGFFPVKMGWNPVTGLGSPNGENLLAFFKGANDDVEYEEVKKQGDKPAAKRKSGSATANNK